MKKNEQFESALEKIKQIQTRLLRSLPERRRWVSDKIEKRRATLLIGPRGVGKTTYLLSNIKGSNESLYLSLDNTLFSTLNLFEFGDWLFNIGYKQIIFDEVHVAQDWSLHLKSLYDSNPSKKIIASDSSTLVLRKGLGDLSRRFVNATIPFLSFREYLWIKYGFELESTSWRKFISTDYAKATNSILNQFHKQQISVIKEFRSYLKEGYRPIFLEKDYSERLTQIVDKIIYQDIPYFLPELKERHIHLMRNILAFIAESPIPRLNIDSLSSKWQVSKTTVYNLIEVMKETSLIRVIQKKGSLKSRSRGEKIFFSDPTQYGVSMGNLGNVREAFFCAEMDRLQLNCFATEDELQGDFMVDDVLFEVGGESKKSKKADIVLRDNIETSESAKVRPLWLLGFCENN